MLLVGGILLWFTVGTQSNVRKGERLMRWLGEGLPVIGPRTTLRWLGSSVAELKIVQPRPPYRDATVMVVLEPRDLGAIWAFAHRRGRRDFLLMRLSLIRAPRFRADVVDPTAWTAGDNRRDEPPFDRTESWPTERRGAVDGHAATNGGPAMDVRALEVRLDTNSDVAALRKLVERLERLSGGVWRVSVRPTVPHLELHLLLPDTAAVGSGELLRAVTDAAQGLSRER